MYFKNVFKNKGISDDTATTLIRGRKSVKFIIVIEVDMLLRIMNLTPGSDSSGSV